MRRRFESEMDVGGQLSTSIKGGVPKGGLPSITRWVLPLQRLLALLKQVLMSTKEAY
jgi:hypothetical protein